MNKKLIKNGLLATLGVVSATIPLVSTVSCGKAEEKNNRVGDKYDKEYGVDEAVYTKLKSSFISQATAGLTEVEASEVKKSLNKTFNTCDAQMDKMNLGYTAASNGLIEYAARAYPNVKLVRETTKKTVKWDDLTVEFEGMVNSMKAYMDNLGIHGDDQTPFIEEARRIFNGTGDTERYPGIVKTVKAKYHDPLMGLIQAKAQMLRCFESVDEKIGLVGASIRLGQFFEDHEIFYDKTTDDNAPNKFDNMKSWLPNFKGKSIEDKIGSILVIKNKKTGKTWTDFEAEAVCPGYVVKPILKGWTEDPIKNEYKLNIDWTCVCSAHKDSKKAEQATAHFYDGVGQGERKAEFDYESFVSDLSKSAGTEYSVILSKQGELKALKDTYFSDTNERIVFDWKESELNINALDAFFFGDRTDNRQSDTNRKYRLDTRTLAMTGINIGSKTPGQNDSNLVRLDSLMQTSAADEGKKQNIDNDLINDLLDNCKIWSNVDFTINKGNNAINDTMNASIHALYANTSYEFDGEGEEKVTEIGTKALNSSWFTITDKSYQYLTEQYNIYSDYTEPYANNMFGQSYDDCDKEVIINSVLYGASALFALDTFRLCFVPIFAGKLPIYIVLLSLTLFSLAVQSAALGLLVHYKKEPLKEFKDEGDKLITNQKVKDFVDYIKDMGNDHYLCRANDNNVVKKGSTSEEGTYLYNFEQFKDKFGDASTFMAKILPVIDKFQKMDSADDWKNFKNEVDNSKCSPSKFDETMKEWAIDGVFSITNYVFTGVQFITDITCIVLLCRCPEMVDWQLMKEARLAAEETGQSTQYVIKTYKTLAEIKELRNAFKANLERIAVAQKQAQQLSGRFVESIDKAGNVVKTDEYFDVLYKNIPDVTDILRAKRTIKGAARSVSGKAYISKYAQDAVNEGLFGYSHLMESIFSLRMVNNNPVTEFDELAFDLAKTFVQNVKAVLAPGSQAINSLQPLKGLQVWFKQLAEPVKTKLLRSLTNADKWIREGEDLLFISEFKSFDNVLIDNLKQIAKSETKAEDVSKIADDAFDALYSPIKWICDRLKTLSSEQYSRMLII